MIKKLLLIVLLSIAGMFAGAQSALSQDCPPGVPLGPGTPYCVPQYPCGYLSRV